MKDHIGYLELQITDSCNLKCKGCSHCSGLIPPNQHIPLEHVKRDLRRMRELVPKIREIRILGGEPFLNPKLEQYIKAVRAYYPDADIRVVTNGLLCLAARKEIYETMRECSVSMDVSSYPPTMDIKEKLEEKFKQEGIGFSFTAPIEKFAKRISLQADSEIEEAFWNCDSKWCNFLRDGILAPCPAPVILDFLAKEYGFEVDTSAGKLDIYREDLTGEEVIAYLNQPNPVCRYCKQLEFFDWEGYAKPKPEHWIVG